MEGLEIPFKAITEGIKSITDFFSNMLDCLNPFSEKFFLKDFFISIANFLIDCGNFFTNLIDWLNPFSDNFFVYKLVELLGNLLKWLFIPEKNPFDELSIKFDEKFAFIKQIEDLFSSLLGFNDYGQTIPSFNMTWNGITFAFIDFSMFLDYRLWLHGIILAIAWFIFIIKTYKKLPGIIGGFNQ